MPIRRTFAPLGAAALLVLAGARTSHAQHIQPIAASSRSNMTDAPSPQPAPVAATKRPLLTWGGVGGGIAGGTVGLFGGMLAGAAMAHAGTCAGEDCSLGRALVGGAIGESIGLAAGVHLASHRKGNLALSALATTAIEAVGALALRRPSPASPAIVVAIPLLQLAAALALER